MSKLLPTQLPQAQGEGVTSSTFNRLIRILEINLQDVDMQKLKKSLLQIQIPMKYLINYLI